MTKELFILFTCILCFISQVHHYWEIIAVSSKLLGTSAAFLSQAHFWMSFGGYIRLKDTVSL